MYYYWLGHFYRRSGIDYEAVHPPYGIVVDDLPDDVERVEVEGRVYYYVDGVFYRPRSGGTYVVVSPPPGALVSYLPGDARRFEGPDGEVFVARGAIYVAVERDGTTWYLVTGSER